LIESEEKETANKGEEKGVNDKENEKNTNRLMTRSENDDVMIKKLIE